MNAAVAIYGAGGHALVVADVVACEHRLRVGGFIDAKNPERQGSEYGGATILGGEEQLSRLRWRGIHLLLPGVGDVHARLRMLDLAAEHDMELATAAHPAAIIARDVTLGPGSVAMAGAIVNPAVTIGRCVILNTACSVDHHCELGDGAQICPGARLAGTVRVGRGAWVGIGAVVRQGIHIGEFAIVGAGAVVVKDVPPGVIVVGNPARILKPNPHVVAQTDS